MKELKDMTISDVLKTPEFYNNLKVVVSDLENTRRNAGMMKVLYANAMDKKLQGYSSSERKFILEVGGEAFNITMKQLVDQEKKDNESIKKQFVQLLRWCYGICNNLSNTYRMKNKNNIYICNGDRSE